jgi:hypothetical protein
MLDTIKRLTSYRIFEEAFRPNRKTSSRGITSHKQAFTVGKLLCLMFFSFARIEDQPKQAE